MDGRVEAMSRVGWAWMGRSDGRRAASDGERAWKSVEELAAAIVG